MSDRNLIRKFDRQAKIYEARRKRQTEKEWREKLIGHAKGRVLEVAVGAGANFVYYPEGVRLTAVDFSGEMLKKAESAAAEANLPVQFLRSDVESLSFPDDSFDTVVSTLSLCGYADPAAVLNKFVKWCRPGGQILLMEHGLSSSRWVAGLQHAANPLFRKFSGCHFNRDILQILKSSNIQINSLERYYLGAVYCVKAAPDK